MKRLMVMSVVVVVSLFLLSSIVLAQDFCKGNFDYDKDVDGTDASVFKQSFGRSQFLNPCPPDGPAPVEKTWQSPSYEAYDDGWYHMGVSWSIRFTDNGNGTITDNLTGLIWLKEANCWGALKWSQALTYAHGLVNGQCGLTDGSIAGNWRLPNLKEMLSLIDYDYYNPAMNQSYFFTNVMTDNWYWSSTTLAQLTLNVWTVSMYNGRSEIFDRTNDFYVWPVRGGHPY